ncbi:hypothetical protein EC846_1560 [Acinetobacter sp. BIGb0102]|uniref:hypothetical protein n=1 Tax=Acinetobacter sp. BIGb0102 TaxID=2485131 RepID=UPI000F4F60E6|nr:hypothetical protein [Acinetobacter sp. BIGb0102]RPE30859.1 hypothetical protein EC846_1560 [Acinetobacter sp. BIGb0102]
MKRRPLHNRLSANTDAISQLREEGTDLPTNPLEDIATNEASQNALMAQQLNDEAKSLEQIGVKIAEMRMEHEREEHALRKEHLRFLSKITIYWLGLISVVSYLQGFKGNGLVNIYIKDEWLQKLPFYISSPKFELTNQAFIALITTTTATILGLYTIAAVWLYKGSKEDKKTEDKQNKDQNTEE